VNSAHNPTYDAALAAKFASAARHSRLVRILRIAVPGAVLLSLAAIVGVSIFNPFRMLMPKLPIDSGNLVVSGTKITMESPHLSGYTPDQRPYELWAKAATQDITDPDHVDLSDLRAKVLMEDQSTLFLDARNGRFDNKQQQLDLHNDIFLRTSSGYEARLNSAFVDMSKGTVSSDDHVDVKLTNGTLTADKLRITEGGEVIRFEGNVVMHLDKLDDPATAQPAPAEPAPPAKTRTPQNKSANSR
jgi:lipopolysaccharide export system protein LptC